MKTVPTCRFTAAARLVPILMVCNSAHALQPLITDDTATQGAGGQQIEFAWTHDRSKSGTDYDRQQSLPFTYSWGATDALDLFIGITPARIKTGATDQDTRGFSNTALGVKWRFHESADRKTSFALKPQLFLPVSEARENAGLGSGKLSGDLTLIASREFSFGALHANLVAGRERYRDTTANPDTRNWRASLAPVWQLTEHFSLVADLGVEWIKERGTDQRSRETFTEIGAICSPNKNLDFALGLIRRSDNQNPQGYSHTATLGLTWRY